jgi:Zn-dependent M28 family amino/carboxypeptidase/uncharacterized protein (DUF1684 family)
LQNGSKNADMCRTALIVLVCAAVVACARGESRSSGDLDPASSNGWHRSLAEMPRIDAAALLEHTKVLASDRFEGRAPGTEGEALTVRYLTEQFEKLGLKPGSADGTYTQRVPLVGITPTPASLVLTKDGVERRLRWKDDVVAWTKRVAPKVSLNDSELVFVGYGIVAPEYDWDDYKGVDVRGKTLVMLINDPPIRNPARPAELDSRMFGGSAMTYYGRWTYKFEIAAQKGAAGALIVHETDAAGYPFDVVQSSWEGEQFDLVTPDQNRRRASVEGWIPVEQAARLLTLAGYEFETLKRQAMTREFKPVPLGIRASVTITNKLRTISSTNVVARLDGSAPALKDEYIVYTAHWDHLGIGTPVDGDRIYNGAKDNAVGTAGLLEIARAYTKLEPPPRRSVLFLAVTAEEQGLLGSAYYAMSPVVPLTQTLAVINMDGLNVYGRTKDLTLIGYGATDLDDYVREAAAEQGRVIRPDAEPEKGYYYRSDHFSFAKRGVPALNPDEGVDFIGKPEGYGQRVRQEYTEHNYHKPSDQVKPDWDLAGAREDLQLFFAVGYRVSNADKFPQWKPGHEFKAVRDAALAHRDEVLKWRAKHEADYMKEYVPLAGLIFLKAGWNTAGGSPSSDVVIPGRVPAVIGRLLYENQRVSFEPKAGAGVRLNGREITSTEKLEDDAQDRPDRLSSGDVTFWVHESGDRRAIRVHDPSGPTARAFAGFKWYPIDERYRVTARFIKDPSPRTVKMSLLSGDDETYKTEGVVEFVLDGQRVRMRPMTTRPGRFYFVFRDATSGHGSYEAARFLYSNLDPDGTTVLDFNEAYNPPCSFNPFTTCPLPLPENRLKVAIPAGEMAYVGHSAR